MHDRTPANTGFKRQIVFRLGMDEWPLLETAVREHGSIQAAVLAGLRALGGSAAEPLGTDPKPEPKASNGPGARTRSVAGGTRTRQRRGRTETLQVAVPATPEVDAPAPEPDEEIPARDAAKLLGLKTSTISGYIRAGRLPGRYEGEPAWQGWLTTRGAIEAYRDSRRT